MGIKPRFPKVIGNCGSSFTTDFYAFFRNAGVARGEIEDLSPRAVGKENLHVEVIFSAVAGALHRPSLDLGGKRGSQERRQVNEVADLADHSAVPLSEVISPMGGRQPSRVHAVQN